MSCLVANSVHAADTDKTTRQDKTRRIVSARFSPLSTPHTMLCSARALRRHSVKVVCNIRLKNSQTMNEIEKNI